MAPRALLALLLALAANDGGAAFHLIKCCGLYQMLSGDGRECVDARWPRNFSINTQSDINMISPPFDMDWLRRWLLPSLHTLVNSSLIYFGPFDIKRYNFVMRVNSSSLWNEHRPYSKRYFSGRMVIDYFYLIRPKKGGGYRKVLYCVDAAKPPLATFVVLYSRRCGVGDNCFNKCCLTNQAIVVKNGTWNCERDSGALWTPYKSAYTGVTDPETPFNSDPPCGGVRGSHPLTSERYKTFFRTDNDFNHEFMFASWDEKCIDYQRNADGSLSEVMGYCEEQRITRGVYWLLRPLPFASALLLAAALLALASNGRMRRTAHGWSVACHAACLLAFNAGQIAFYLLIGDEWMEDVERNEGVSLYFLLIAAASWLTALCFNMSQDFGKLRLEPSSSREIKKRFLWLSLFAWGLPTIMTAVSSSLIAIHPPPNPFSISYNESYFSPTLAETRSCYGEIREGENVIVGTNSESKCKCSVLVKFHFL